LNPTHQRLVKPPCTASHMPTRKGALSRYADFANSELRTHVPANFDTATLEQMISTDHATPREITLLAERRERLVICRNVLVAKQGSLVPDLGIVLQESHAKLDQNLIDLAQQRRTWGEFVMRGREINNELRRRMTEVMQQVGSGLATAHQQELTRRQAAFEAYQRNQNEQQALQNQQRMLLNQQIQSFGSNRPVQTNCNLMGSYVSCTSH